MANGIQIPRPKVALQQAVRLPDQVLPAALGRPLSNVLSSDVDALPDISLPASLPTLPLPQGLQQAPPGPKQFVQRAETVLPAGFPKIASLIPDIALPAFTGSGGGFRPLEKTSTAPNGTIRSGGYRSI